MYIDHLYKRSMQLTTHLCAGQPELGALLPGGNVLRLQSAHLALAGQPHTWLADMLSFLRGDQQARDLAARVIEEATRQRPHGSLVNAQEVTLLPPVPVPESIREFMNFEQHVINCTRKFGMSPWQRRMDEWVERRFGRRHTLAFKSNAPWYERPVYYKGNRFSVVGHDADIVIPRYTNVFDYELEFGIFLSRGGRDIPKTKARDHIGGYVVFNDFSARDIQGREMGGRLGPAKGKDFDTGNAIGPVLVTPDEVPDPYALTMRARINGEEVSLGSSRDMRFTFEDLLAYVSQSETLHPGEFFGSGTCSGALGVGCGVEHGRFLKPGDVIELEVERLGILRNRIVAASAERAAA
jgi:2-keto-4-pentenoate hydratase/2-oxohepta-3-ene-1,7-dioic acid hydratase in catechol pathway